MTARLVECVHCGHAYQRHYVDGLMRVVCQVAGCVCWAGEPPTLTTPQLATAVRNAARRRPRPKHRRR